MNDRSLIGAQLGKYQVQEEIGRGGMGAVYKAHDVSLDRYVAIKVLAPHLVWQEGFVERFVREARAAARLQHPNIVTIYDVGQEGDWYYYVMECLEGQTLTEFIQQQGAMQPSTIMSILRPLAEALDYAHHNGLVHRDIKPSNIVIGRGGRVSLTDFGIARAAQETRLTATGTMVGTPEYMSPEQVQGHEVDASSDQYSLAVVAYEMLSGEVPFEAESTLALMYKVVHEPPPPIREKRPDLPKQVEGVVGKGLAKEPGNRYATVCAFTDALERALAGKRAVAAPRRGPAVAAAAAARARPSARQPRVSTPASATKTEAGAAPATAAAGRRPATAAAPTRKGRGFPIWIWLLAALTVLVLAVALVLALSGGGDGGTPTAVAVVTRVVTSRPADRSPSPPPEGTPSASIAPAKAPTRTLAPAPGPDRGPTPTRTPTLVPTATSTPTLASRLPTSTPAATRVPSATPAPPKATATTAPTKPRPTATKPRPTATKPRPTATKAPTKDGVEFRAPNLLGPPDGQVFSPVDVIVLEWERVGTLGPDVYYEPVVAYSPARASAETWYDETPWTKETRWVLSEHDYLPALSSDGKFRWSVRVMRLTGKNAQGRPIGTALSPMSGERTLIWPAPSEGGAPPGPGPGPPTRTPRPP